MLFNFPFFNERCIITLNQFLQNPSGKSASYMGRRDKIKEDLENRYYKLLKKENGKFNMKLYKDKEAYIFIFKIPSETHDDFYYDVVLEFIPHKGELKEMSTMIDYSINFFSNSPHMTFTYTYVLNHNKVLVDWLKPYKCSKEALKNKPKVTNPVEVFGFEKSCYYVALYIKNLKFFNKYQFETNCINIKSKQDTLKIINSIDSQDKKINDYNLLKQREIDAKKKKKEAQAKEKVKQQSKTKSKNTNYSSSKRVSKKNVSYSSRDRNNKSNVKRKTL